MPHRSARIAGIVSPSPGGEGWGEGGCYCILAGSGMREGGEARGQLIPCRRTSIHQQPKAKNAFLFRGNGPVAQGRHVWIDQALFVRAPARGMIRVGGMIEHGDAKSF